MKRSAPLLESSPIWHELTQREEIATASLFLGLCRSSPVLTHWLLNEFAREARIRDEFLRALRDETAGRAWEITFAGESEAWRAERRQLQAMFPAAQRAYGGLTRKEVEQLVRHYQSAGTIDLGVFLLAKRWRQKRRNTLPPAVLIRTAITFLDAVAPGGEALLNDFTKALRHLDAFQAKSSRAGIVGYQDWWKLNLALYILQNPRPEYRTRDIVAHLRSLGIEIAQRYVRRFCALHGIARDTTAGRPRRLRKRV